MLNESLSKLFEVNLNKLAHEISLYRDEDNLWVTRDHISNSSGNLCLHLMGNLNHFIGHALGHTGYVRHRDDEFNLSNIPRQDLLLNIDNCKLVVLNTLKNLTQADLEHDFPLEKHGEIVSTEYMLLHLLGHLTYHIGQINYHRRLTE
jgi:hypothetical protein